MQLLLEEEKSEEKKGGKKGCEVWVENRNWFCEIVQSFSYYNKTLKDVRCNKNLMFLLAFGEEEKLYLSWMGWFSSSNVYLHIL